MKSCALVLAVASCVDTAPAFPLTVPTTPGVSEVGSFHLKASDDDVHNTCAPGGARDVSFALTSEIPQTVVFDTDPDPTKTNTAVAISLFDGPCPAQQVTQCAITPCPGMSYGSLAATLAPHPYCLVVEEADPSSSLDLVTLRMFTSGRQAAMIFDSTASGMMMGNTCTGDDPNAAAFSCAAMSGPPSSAALVTACPGEGALMGVTMTEQPTAFSLRATVPQSPEIAGGCFTADGTTPVDASVLHSADMVTGPQPYWLLIERATPTVCGSFELTLTAQ